MGLVRRRDRPRHHRHHRLRPEGPRRRRLRRAPVHRHRGRHGRCVCSLCAASLYVRLWGHGRRLTRLELTLAFWLRGWLLLEEMGAVESVKAASDIFAPVSGKVEEVNGELDGQPDLLNKDAEGAGAFYPCLLRSLFGSVRDCSYYFLIVLQAGSPRFGCRTRASSPSC